MAKVICAECGVEFNKPPSQMRSEKGNNFCKRSCAVAYNNKHKEVGIKRSKIEVWMEQRIKETYPDLELHCNRKDSGIGSELDIYIPSLRLAFEIHGPTHYIDVYGPNILEAKQKMDAEKREACKAVGIELHEIDVSKIKDFKRSWEFVSAVEKVLNTIRAKKAPSTPPLDSHLTKQ
jgi:hypothetical protein